MYSGEVGMVQKPRFLLNTVHTSVCQTTHTRIGLYKPVVPPTSSNDALSHPSTISVPKVVDNAVKFLRKPHQD